MVGACAAFELRRAGFDVTLIEQSSPGAGASAGNAGSIGVASVPPFGMPGTIGRVPRMLRDPLHPLKLRVRDLPSTLPWFLRFARATRPASVEAIADARAALLARAGEATQALLAAIGRSGLVERTGLIHTFESEAARARAEAGIAMRRRRGVRLQAMTGDALRELEPALSERVVGGVWYPDVLTSVDPRRMTAAIVEAFVAAGGRFAIDTVRGFEPGPDGPRAIVTDRGAMPCEQVVIAAGAWSRPLAAALGCDVPLVPERGYHVMIGRPSAAPRIPLVCTDHHVAITRMTDGLRLSTMSEFAAIGAAPNHERAWRILERGAGTVRGLRFEATERWVGSRPATPDSLPVIGRLPASRRVILCFGHGHVGLTLGAISGRLVAQIARGDATELDLRACRPDRRFTGGDLVDPAQR
jgi:D-amino-acid dehydrogenase